MGRALWKGNRRRLLAVMAIEARKTSGSWAAGRDTFTSQAWDYLHWPHGGNDESKRREQLWNLYDKETRAQAEPVPAVPLAANGGALSPRSGPPRLGFWDRREMLRQLERCKLQVGVEAHTHIFNEIRRKASIVLEDSDLARPEIAFDSVARLDELEREVYRRFGLGL